MKTWVVTAAVALGLIGAAGCGKSAPETRSTAGAVVSSGTNIKVSPSPLDFEVVGAATTKQITIENTGASALTITSVAKCAVPGSVEFSFAAVATPLVIAGGATATVAVTYTPGAFSTTDFGCITIASDDATAPSIDVTVQGDFFSTANTCSNCHGNKLRTPWWTAPAPPAFANSTDTAASPSDIRVGAHQAHVNPAVASLNPTGPLSKPLYCKHCHYYPPVSNHNINATNHTWSTLATHDGALTPALTFSAQTDPVWGLPVNATCSSVYCHGATLSGGTNKTPIWNQVDGTQAGCGTCHGVPPPTTANGAAHTTSLECGGCHTGYTSTSVNVATHINGTIDIAAGGACGSCHAMPPATTASGAAHTTSTDCGNCHPGYTSASANTAIHMDGTVNVDYSNSPCGSCHAVPPDTIASGNPHPMGSTCGYCHPGYTSSTTNTTLHVNGVVDFDTSSTSCGQCHGLPPATTASGAAHTTSNACGNCHPGYGASVPPTHINGIVEVDLTNATCTDCHGSPPATLSSGVAHPASTTCGACHPGYTQTTANSATHRNGTVEYDSSGAACGDCHGIPPATTTGGATHTQSTLCGSCHDGYTSTAVNSATHINGAVDVKPNLTCGGCHAIPPATMASGQAHPTSTSCGSCHLGYTSTTVNDATHVNGTIETDIVYACGVCHALPPTTMASGNPHPTSTACGNCHPGYTSSSVDSVLHDNGTVEVDTTTATCGTCHAVPPATVAAGTPHPTGSDCGACHPGYTADTVNPILHVNGLPDFDASGTTCGSCHGLPPATLASGAAHTTYTTCGNCHLGYTSATVNTTTHINGYVDTDMTQVACGDCHGIPPATVAAGTAHPAGECGNCHLGYTASTVNTTLHVNGAIDFDASQTPCGQCHAIPPATTAAGTAHPAGECGNCHTGYTATTVNTANHINGSVQFDASQTPCGQCHAIPPATTAAGTPHPTGACANCHPGYTATTVNAANHINGTVQYDSSGTTCGQCHGVPPATTAAGTPHPAGECADCHPGYTATTVNATSHINGTVQYDSSGTTCGGCHAVPPTTIAAGTPHPTGATCANCHAGYTATTVNTANHINGTVNYDSSAATCGQCHGIPPATTASGAAHTTNTTCVNCHPGYTATTVNAATHINGYVEADTTNVPCGGCHAIPPATTASGAAHPTSDQCGGCHPGYTSTSVNSATHINGNVEYNPDSACGSCHAIPPPAPHTASTNCAGCHPGYTSTTTNSATHINNVVDLTASCTSCHGDATRAAAIAPAPPVDTAGNTATSGRGVGAHQAHLTTGTVSNGFACNACHATPTDMGHKSGTAETSFSLLAKARNASATWTGTTCSNYCHGSTLGSGSNHSPNWTTVNGTQDACGTCHGANTTGRPSSGEHTLSDHNIACTQCHGGSAAPDKAQHVNGLINMATGSMPGWNATNRSCSNSCHSSKSWGGTAYTIPATIYVAPGAVIFGTVNPGATVSQTVTVQNIGTASLTVNSVARCSGTSTEFSVSPTAGFSLASGAKQTLTITYAPTATTEDSGCIAIASSDSTHNPTNVNVAGNLATDPTQVFCGSCHAIPPATQANGTAHTTSTSCGNCHPGYTSTTVNSTVHQNGTVNIDYTNAPCGSCHAIPPATVASGAAHTTNTQCGGCHPGYTSTSVNATTHVNGVVNYDPTNAPCGACHAVPPATVASGAAHTTNTDCNACHPGNTATTVNTATHNNGTVNFDPTNAPCGTCHAIPPATVASGAAHTTSTSCGDCHPGNTATTVNAATHNNGTVNYDPSNAPCGTCHAIPPATTASGAAHTTSTDCGSCHPGYTSTTVNSATHDNGTVEANGGCASCHGDVTRAAAIEAAPPADTAGHTTTSYRGVGAHQAHLTGGTVSNAFACDVCHAVPTSAGHQSGAAETSFNLLAKARSTAASWNGTSCSNYCHGGKFSTGSIHNPSWTTVNGTQDACGTCHGSSSNGRPNTGLHTSKSDHVVACTTCHAGTSAPDKSIHVNGIINMNTSVGWSASNRTCSNSCHGTESWGGTAYTVTPTLYVATGTVMFGDNNVGSTTSQTVAIQNIGTSSLTVNSLAKCSGTSSVFSLSSTSGFTLAAGAKQNVTVSYTPTGTAGDAGCFTIASSDSAHNPTTVNLVGRGLPVTPGISASPSPLAFGTVAQGSTTTKTLTVSNTGNGSLSVTSIGLCTGTTSGFSVSPSTLTVAAGSTGTVNVTFAPSAIGTVAAASCVSLVSNDTAHTPYTVPLTGEVVAAQAAISATPNPLAFGTVNVGATSTKAVTVSNSGNATLSVSSIARCSGTSTEFTVSPSTLSVAPGSTGTVNVTFAPTAAGTVASDACIAFTSNAPAYTVGLTGSATATAANISATPNPLAFGTVNVNSTTTKSLTVSNTGTATLSVSSIARCSGTSTAFTVSPSTLSVAPGSTGTVNVTYAPTSAGTVADGSCIAFTSNAPAYTVGLTGSAVAATGPIISATPNPLAFGSVSVDHSKSLTLTVQNTGSSTLSVSSVSRCTDTSTSFSTSSSSFSISAGGTRSLTVTFRPGSERSYTGCFRFSSNDSAHNPYYVNVSGTGTH